MKNEFIELFGQESVRELTNNNLSYNGTTDNGLKYSVEYRTFPNPVVQFSVGDLTIKIDDVTDLNLFVTESIEYYKSIKWIVD